MFSLDMRELESRLCEMFAIGHPLQIEVCRPCAGNADHLAQSVRAGETRDDSSPAHAALARRGSQGFDLIQTLQADLRGVQGRL
jgi:hypothetical protein